MNEKILQQNINRLNVSCKVIDLLKQKKITTIKQICSRSKDELKNLGITANEIKQIEVQLQLEGLDFNAHY